MTATAYWSAADLFQERRRVGGGKAMDGEARQRQAGDVHLFDRAMRILQSIEGRFGDEIQAGGTQRFEQRPQRHPLSTGQLLEIGEREA